MAEKTSTVEQLYRTCPADASDLVWKEIPMFPGIWAWCCPECEHFEF